MSFRPEQSSLRRVLGSYHCGGNRVHKHGRTRNGKQRFEGGTLRLKQLELRNLGANEWNGPQDVAAGESMSCRIASVRA